jgi:predicted DNA-binding transcriptional regulator AlpA
MADTPSLPNWPRLMSAELAASYVGLPKTTFLERVNARRFPSPLREGNRKLWDRRMIDQAIDLYSGLTSAPMKESGWEDMG